MSSDLITKFIRNFDRLDPAQKSYSRFIAKKVGTIRNQSASGSATERIIEITTSKPDSHLRGLNMRTSPLRGRRTATDIVTGYSLDSGIFTGWRFIGSKGADSLTFGSQGHIFSKRNTGLVDFRVDNAKDVFTFTNTINIAKCTAKHGFVCSRYNHLSNVTIKNFGQEDILNIQGDIYTYNDIKKGLPGDLASRLSVELIPSDLG